MKPTKTKVSVLLLSAALISSGLSLGMLSTTASAATLHPVMSTPAYTLAQIQKDRPTQALPMPAALPAAVDNTAAYPPPGNQGNQGSCTAWAVSYAYKTMQENVDHGWGVSTTATQFSPSFVYNQINGGRDAGSYISDAMQLLKDKGDTTLADMPYNQSDYRTQPTAQQLANAYPHRSASYASLSGTTALKNSIVTSGGAAISIPIYSDFDNISASNPVYDVMNGTLRGYHAVALIGYDDAKQAFKLINSWGTTWGLSGYGWIAYSLVDNPNAGIYGYTMTDMLESSVSPNNDGYPDIVGFGNAGVVVAVNNGGTGFKAATLSLGDFGYTAGGWRVDQHPRMVVDMNKDGYPDIVGFANAGVVVALNKGGTGFKPSTLWINTFGYTAGGWRVDMHPRMVVDLNNDGYPDIVGFGDAGVYVALNNGGTGLKPATLWFSGFGYSAGGWRVDKHPRMVVDVNKDGYPDIVGFGDAGVGVALNNGGTGFKPATLWFSGFGYSAGGWRVDKHPRMVIDVNKDGYADIVGFGDAGVGVALNNGGTGFKPATLWINTFGYTAGGWRVDQHPRMII